MWDLQWLMVFPWYIILLLIPSAPSWFDCNMWLSSFQFWDFGMRTHSWKKKESWNENESWKNDESWEIIYWLLRNNSNWHMETFSHCIHLWSLWSHTDTSSPSTTPRSKWFCKFYLHIAEEERILWWTWILKKNAWGSIESVARKQSYGRMAMQLYMFPSCPCDTSDTRTSVKKIPCHMSKPPEIERYHTQSFHSSHWTVMSHSIWFYSFHLASCNSTVSFVSRTSP